MSEEGREGSGGGDSALGRGLALVEKFVSIQGEGENAGRRAVFLRLAGCNLRCRFAEGSYCDTPYWDVKEKTTVEEVVAWVGQVARKDATSVRSKDRRPMIVITGGEPTLQPEFDNLVHALEDDYYIAVETNGTRWRDSLIDIDWLVVSPKEHVAQEASSQSPLGGVGPVFVPELDSRVKQYVDEYRYVIGGLDDPTPPYMPGIVHYVSPAFKSDGMPELYLTDPTATPPEFAQGAVLRCLEIISHDPRWKLSLQTHKWIRVR